MLTIKVFFNILESFHSFIVVGFFVFHRSQVHTHCNRITLDWFLVVLKIVEVHNQPYIESEELSKKNTETEMNFVTIVLKYEVKLKIN